MPVTKPSRGSAGDPAADLLAGWPRATREPARWLRSWQLAAIAYGLR